MSTSTDQTPAGGGIESLSVEELRRVVEQAAVGMIVAGPDGRGIYANARYCQMLGYTPEECVGMGMADFVHPDEDVDPAAVVAALREGRLDGYEVERRWRRKDGSALWGLVNVKTFRQFDGGPVTHFIIQILDIGARKYAEAKLTEAFERLQLAVEAGNAGTFYGSAAQDQYHWDGRMYEIYGREPGSFDGTLETWVGYVHADDRERVDQEAQETIEHTMLFNSHFRVIHGQTGQVRHIEGLARATPGANGKADRVIGMNWDVTEHVSLEESLREEQQRLLEMRLELKHYVDHDHLTGLFNRSAFERELREAVNRAVVQGRNHVLAVMEVDRFRVVNEGASYRAGDALLCQVADIVKQHLVGGGLAGRVSGAKFALLVPDRDLDAGERIAGQLADAVEGLAFNWEGRHFDVGAKIGLATVGSRDHDGSEDPLIQASAACHVAVPEGSGRVVAYDRSQGAALRYRRGLRAVSEITQAIDAGRLQLFAQEIHALSDAGRSRYYEILLRLRETGGRLVPPGSFISAAERHGLMGRLDRWVIRTLLHDYGARLHDAGVTVAVNVSASTLNDPESWAFVREGLEATGLRPGFLHLEITETEMINNLSAAVSFVNQARDAGCGITLDDFGTGMSSLSYLRRFGADTIKIDGMFIRQLVSNNVDRAIIESITVMARRLNAVTVAEHVEDAETLTLVAEIGIDYAQGHAIAYPAPLEEILTRLPAD